MTEGPYVQIYVLKRASESEGGRCSAWYVEHRPGHPEEGSVRELDPRHDLYNHSPDGFEWGYGGSGPAQLALAILAHATCDARLSLRLYQLFKREVIATLDRTSHEIQISAELVDDWVKNAAKALPKVGLANRVSEVSSGAKQTRASVLAHVAFHAMLESHGDSEAIRSYLEREIGMAMDELGLGPAARARTEEPVFVLRAQDRMATATIEHWVEWAKTHGVSDAKRDHVEHILDTFVRWADEHQTKVPD